MLRLRAASFNIHGARPAAGPPDLAAIGRVIRELQADLCGLQELHRFLPLPGSFCSQPRRLSALVGSEVWFSPSFGWGPIGYGNGLISTLPVEKASIFRLPGSGERRALLKMVLRVESRTVTFFNTHLGLSPEARIQQVELIRERLREVDGPAVLVGDLNAAPGSRELLLLAQAGLRSAVPPEAATFPSHAPVLRLDHVLVSRHFQVLGGAVVDTQVSDHRPIYADLGLE